tara:strand:- start:115 stop:264 length:150 start_codon:yes stop_codon:yes gene_type:complete
MKKNKKTFIIWLILVVSWNFGFPKAPPAYDVLVAVLLSLFIQYLNNKII